MGSGFDILYDSVFGNILAKENLFVQIDKNAKTAAINMETRVIHLPDWKGTHALQRFLMIHETGHARFTPVKEWKAAIESRPKEEQASYKDILNVFEDVRIDRMNQQTHNIMKKWYYEGTEDLFDEFFKVTDKIHNSPLIDRINVFYKTQPLNNRYNISFTQEEKEWIEALDKVKSFDDVKRLSDLFFEKYPEISASLESIIIPLEFSSKVVHDSSTVYLPDSDYRSMIAKYSFRNDKIIDINIDFVRKMINRFERKKNAKISKRIKIKDTGILNPAKLYQYKTNDNIFLKNMLLEKQKNHGFLLIIDISGSMNGVIKNVTEHVKNIGMFCHMLNIPFDSYAFSEKRATKKCEITNNLFCFIPLINSKMRRQQIVKYPIIETIGGTPLTSAIHYTKTLALDFIKTNHVDVCNIIFLTDGACTSPLKASRYIDKTSRISVGIFPDFLGKNSSVAPLLKILKERTQANVFVYYMDNSAENNFSPDLGGATGVFFLNKNVLEKNKSVFVNMFIDQMVKYNDSGKR